jgi:hypothetical protein
MCPVAVVAGVGEAGGGVTVAVGVGVGEAGGGVTVAVGVGEGKAVGDGVGVKVGAAADGVG